MKVPRSLPSLHDTYTYGGASQPAVSDLTTRSPYNPDWYDADWDSRSTFTDFYEYAWKTRTDLLDMQPKYVNTADPSRTDREEEPSAVMRGKEGETRYVVSPERNHVLAPRDSGVRVIVPRGFVNGAKDCVLNLKVGLRTSIYLPFSTDLTRRGTQKNHSGIVILSTSLTLLMFF